MLVATCVKTQQNKQTNKHQGGKSLRLDEIKNSINGAKARKKNVIPPRS